MISWVAMDRIVERKRSADAAYRKQAAGMDDPGTQIEKGMSSANNPQGPRATDTQSKRWVWTSGSGVSVAPSKQPGHEHFFDGTVSFA